MKKRWISVILAAVGVLVALWLAILGSSVSARNKVGDYKNQLCAAGEKLNIEDVIPPRLPRERNSVDIVRDVISRLNSSRQKVLRADPPPAMRMVGPGKAMIGWQQPKIRNDYATNTWEEMELALETQADVLNSLRNLPDQPRFDFELDYRSGAGLMLPHLSGMKTLAQFLQRAAMSDLHRGDTASATTNIHTSLAFVNGWKDEPRILGA